MKLNVEELLQTKAYDFLRENEHLKDKTITYNWSNNS